MIVFFDCDSTLSTLEGIDELAMRAGVGAEMAALTHQAMNGTLSLEEVYARRLESVRPDRRALEWLGGRYIETIVPGAAEVIGKLRARGDDVHVISGGLLGPVRTFVVHLGVASQNVHAVPILFDNEGGYAGFDKACPLARNGGKAEVCRQVVDDASTPTGPFPHSAIVGDGNTDLEAGTVCDLVIGFGGVVARENVRRGADHFINELSLVPVLQLLGG